MGVRGGDLPNEVVPIACLLGDVLNAEGTALSEFSDLEPFEVGVLHPGRTLLERLVHVHAVAQALDHDITVAPDRRIGRHFYDIYQLLGDDRVRMLLGDRDEFKTVMSSIETVTRAHFGGTADTELRPDGGFAASPAFALETDTSLRLQATYEATIEELYFGKGPPPTWEMICRRVAEMRDLL